MSGIKKRKLSSINQKGFEIAFKNGFRRFIIKSDDNGKLIGVYYTAPNGEILKNTNDVIDWLDRNENEKTNINRSYFNFISKRLTKDELNENLIDQNKLPSELVDFVLKKKKSVAPGITGVGDLSQSVLLEGDNNEPEEKKFKSSFTKLKTNEFISDANEVIIEKNQITLKDNEIISNTNEDNQENNEVIVKDNAIILEDNEMISNINEDNLENNEVIFRDNAIILEDNEVILRNNEIILEDNEMISNTNEDNLENNEVIFRDNATILEDNEMISNINEDNLENNEVILRDNATILEDNEMISNINKDNLENNEVIMQKNKIILEDNEMILENNEIISNTNEMNLENNELILKDNELILEDNEILSNNNEDNLQNKDILLLDNKVILEDSETISSTNGDNLEDNEVILQKNEIILEDSETISNNDEYNLQNNEVLLEDNEVILEDSETISKNNEVNPQNNLVILEDSETISSTNEDNLENNEVISDDDGVMPGLSDILRNICEDEINIENMENNLKNNKNIMEIKKIEEISLENLVFKPLKPYEFPCTPMNQQYIFETGNMCHIDKLVQSPNVDLRNVIKEFRPYCNNSCAFDYNGLPRITFECDICLVLWHTDCIGYRWINIESLKLIICDNCFLLQKTNKVQYPNIFCDIEKLYLQEMKSEKNTDNRVFSTYEPLLKLYKVQKHLNQNNQKNLKASKKILKNDFECVNNGKCKHFYQTQINQENILHEMKEDIINFKYDQESIDRLSKIFADSECRLRLNNINYEIISSRLTIKKREIFIPVKTRINKPCSAVFYTVDHGQDENDAYRYRCDELKTALIESYFSNLQPNDGKIIRPIPITPVLPKVGPANRFKIISSHIILPRPSTIINSSVLNSNPTRLPNQISNLIKLRQRKQDFGNQKCLKQAHNYMRNKQFHLLNLPFTVLERILSSNLLSTQDKLNCRLTCRVFKCIIDGSQVWRKLVINPNSITGLDNMLNYFRTKYVKKITFNIDFQESFGMEFLLSLISRLKIAPDYMSLDKLSIKFMGPINIQTPSQLYIHDILSSCKSLKSLSISSENPFVLAMSKKKLASNSLEKLKLKNIQNVYYVIQTNAQLTPNLRKLFCGDWSFVTSIEQMHLSQITNLEMYISHIISMSDMSGLSMLTNLEILSISRPLINEDLINLIVYILQPKRLRKITLNTLVPAKNSFDSCYKLSRSFPKVGVKIIWKIELESAAKFTDRNHIKFFTKEVQESLTNNVKLIYSTPTGFESN